MTVRRVWWLFALVGIGIGFLSLLCYYGDTLLPHIPDEGLFIQPAQNLTEGKGMGTPLLDGLLPGIDQRTYWQPPVYFLALSAWGKLFGFDLLSARWFNRLLGVLGLLLLFTLARRWGLPSGVSLFCVLWTALDLHYQYDANIARMDMLNLVFLLASVMAFTEGMKSQSELAFLTSGVFGALAVLTHLVSVPAVFALLIYLAVRRSIKQAVWFFLPLLLGLLGWLAYALQDWTAFVGQMALQFQRKETGSLDVHILHLLFLQGLTPLFGFSPVNQPPIWLGLLCVTTIALKRRHSPLTDWQALFIGAAYLSAAAGGETWYVGWFAPLGYLMAGLWGNAFLHAAKMRAISLAVALLWSGYQALKVGQTFTGVPAMQSDIARFVKELTQILPQKSTVLLHSVPDPYPSLRHLRPDLRLYQLSPTPMKPETLQNLKRQADFFVGLREWVGRQGILNRAPHPKDRAWTMRTPLGAYRLWLVSLSPDPYQTYPRGNAKGFKEVRP